MACLLQLAPKLHRIWQCTTDQKTIANPVGCSVRCRTFAASARTAVCPILCAAARRHEVRNVRQRRLFATSTHFKPNQKPNKRKASPRAWLAGAYKKRSRDSLAAEDRKRTQASQSQVVIRRILLPVTKPTAYRSGNA